MPSVLTLFTHRFSGRPRFKGKTSGEVFISSSALIGNAKGGGDSTLSVSVIGVDDSDVEELLYETERSIGDVIYDLNDTWGLINSILHVKLPAQEIAEEITDALESASNPVESWQDRQFDLSTTVYLEAGVRYNWDLSLISSVDSIAALNACNVTAIAVNLDLEEVSIQQLGVPEEVKISGYVRTTGGSRIDSVTVSASNGGGTDTTGSGGYYELTVPYGWTGTVTPTKSGYIFSSSKIYSTAVSSDKTEQNYTGTLVPSPDSVVKSFTATEDANVSEDYPTSSMNSANSKQMTVWEGGGDYGEQRAFLKFDLSSIPQGSQVDGATLKLYCDMFTYDENRSTILVCAEDWDEGSVTWNSQPDHNTDLGYVINYANAEQDVWNEIGRGGELIDVVQDWVNGDIPN